MRCGTRASIQGSSAPLKLEGSCDGGGWESSGLICTGCMGIKFSNYQFSSGIFACVQDLRTFSYQESFSAIISFHDRSRSSRFERIPRTFRYQKGFSSIRRFFFNQKFFLESDSGHLAKNRTLFPYNLYTLPTAATAGICRKKGTRDTARLSRSYACTRAPPPTGAPRLRQALSSRCVSDASPLARHRSYHPPSHSAPAAGIVIVSRQ